MITILRKSGIKVKNREVWDKTDGRCWFCGAELIKPSPDKHLTPEEKRRWYTIDHATPKSRGGDHTLDNLLPACSQCNSDKGDLTVEEYRMYLLMRSNSVPYFSKTQLEYLESIGVDILGGLSYQFWAERQGKK